jgi:hypothetical protein
MNRYSLVAWGDCSEGGIPYQRQDGWMDELDTKREDTDSSVAWPFRNTWLPIAGRINSGAPAKSSMFCRLTRQQVGGRGGHPGIWVGGSTARGHSESYFVH